jgi:hypothetical protein
MVAAQELACGMLDAPANFSGIDVSQTWWRLVVAPLLRVQSCQDADMFWDPFIRLQFHTDSITAKLQSLVVEWLMDISNKLKCNQAMPNTRGKADLHAL